MASMQKEDILLPSKDSVQIESSLNQVQGGNEQSPAPVPNQDVEEEEPGYAKSLHKASVSKSFDISSMKTYILEAMKAKDLFKQALDEDSRFSKWTIVDMAGSRLIEALSLLEYLNYQETDMLQVPNQTKEAETGPKMKQIEEADAENTIPDPKPSPWKKEVQRQKRCTDRYGGARTYDIDEVVSGKYSQPGLRTGGPILTHYRQVSSELSHSPSDAFTNQLEINSPLLIEALRSAIDHYAGDDFKALKGDTVIFDEPYMMLFHNRKKLLDYANIIKDEAKDHLMYLLDFLRQELPHISQTLDEIEEKKCKIIDFNTLWLLYNPAGTTVFTRVDQEWRAFQVASLGGFKQQNNGVWSALQLTKTWMTLTSTGNALFSKTEEVSVANFDDEVPIANLEYVPQGYLLDESELRKQLISRGKRYWSFRNKSSYLEYTGSAWIKTMESDATRVIVDHRQHTLPRCTCSLCTLKIDPVTGFPSDEAQIQFSSVEDVAAHPDETLLLLPHTVPAFSLRKKSWRDVEISKLRQVDFAINAFDKLVIKKPHKKLIVAMAKSFFAKNADFADLVQGKGRGLIILLHGSPGTGKTLTAECLAENEQRPLYMITCGELGTEAEELETKLRSAFEDATRWGAVLLLDEADVFLQERDVRDLKRNALVSVFLRELEYFDGILFLTTNRPGLLDEAFQSRIHITLHLDDLSSKDQLRIWLIFLQQPNLNLGESEIENIFRELQTVCNDENLNGRQIRNNVRTATALAATEGNKISMAHIKAVMEVGKQFALYRKKLDGMEPRDRQAALGLRAKS